MRATMPYGRAAALAAIATLAVLLVLTALAGVLAWPRAELIASAAPADYAATPANLARGAYLAKVGDCMACHTVRGGVPYAGGRALATPFGRLVAPNITPDRAAGIGAWSPDDFWNALHNGIARDGRLLYPAFPYTNYTKITRADADALFAFLRSVPASARAATPSALRFPYNQQAMLAGWRLLYFKPAVFAPITAKSPAWNRGAYLVEGLGHCSACHSARNGIGASVAGLRGGLIPMLGWYAPPLTSDREAGLGNWDGAHIAELLQSGVAPRAAVFGPMAEVVAHSLQYLSGPDARAMALYLKALPLDPDGAAEAPEAPEAYVGAQLEQFGRLVAQGKKLYDRHCADCHGADGQGAPPAYPPLAGNGVLSTAASVNAVRIVLNGGFAPSTARNPRPYGMPPFGQVLDDAEVAAVLTYLRANMGGQAAPVSADEVNRYRGVPPD